MAKNNKFIFFSKTKNISNIFITFLFVLTFVLILFNKTDYILIKKIKSSSLDIISPVTKVITSPFVFFSNIANNLNDFKILKNENAKLKEEVTRLKKWQLLALKNQRENKAYKKLLNSTNNNIDVIKTASVIAKTPGIYSNTIVINAGKNQGLSEDLAIINERGLVGKVISTSDNKSKILLINDQNSSVPVRTFKGDYFAIIKGSTNNKYLISSFIKNEKKPKVGDLLITSGNSNIFPQDVLVGKVLKVNNNHFIALPFVDFDNLDFVQAVKSN